MITAVQFLFTECPDMKPVRFEGADCVERANGRLLTIAQRGPSLGYYKTDVDVTLHTGVSIHCRFDVARYGKKGNDIDVVAHVERYLGYLVQNWKDYGGAVADQAKQTLADLRAEAV